VYTPTYFSSVIAAKKILNSVASMTFQNLENGINEFEKRKKLEVLIGAHSSFQQSFATGVVILLPLLSAITSVILS